MSDAALKTQILDDMKAAMKAGEKQKVGAIRLISAAIKQREVDERKDMSDQDILAILDKMAKQRRESITQYEQAGRQELVDQEQFELGIIQTYMPEPLSDTELAELIQAAINETGAASIKDMGKVMGIIKGKAQGRADMGKVSQQIKAQLNG